MFSTPKKPRLNASSWFAEPEMRCVSSGTTSQFDDKFAGAGRQCTAMAFIASALSVIKNRSVFTTDDINIILNDGDKLYIAREPLIPKNISSRYLSCDELPAEIRVGQNLVTIESMQLMSSCLGHGYYPTGENNRDIKLLELLNILTNNVFKSDYDEKRDSVLFTGNGYTVCFWRHNQHYYYFNSHAVNVVNQNTPDGVARLFECKDINSLTKILLNYGNCTTGIPYTLNRVRVLNHISMQSDSILQQSPTLPTYNVSSDSDEISPSILNKYDYVALCNEPLESVNMSINVVKHVIEPKKSKSNSAQNTILNKVDNLNYESDYNKSTLNAKTTAVSHIVNNDHEEISPSILDKFVSPSDISDPVQNIAINSNRISNVTKTNINKTKTAQIIRDEKINILKPVAVIEHLETNTSTSSTNRGRPKKNKRGIKSTKINAHLDAVKKYNIKKPEVNRTSVKKYSDKNPCVNKASVKKYQEKNPDVHLTASQKYNKNKPQVHRDAVKKFTETHPNINEQSVQKYTSNSRNIDVPLRKSKTLIGEKRGDELKIVPKFSLKKTDLNSPDIHTCPYCHTRLFEEEKSRTQWCCGSGANNVQNFTPLTEDFYSNPAFLKRPRAYNNLFSFSALGTTHGFHQPEGIAFLTQGRVYHRVFDLAYDRSTNNIGLYINDSSERESLAAGLGLDKQIIRTIANYMHNINPFIECFRRLSLEASSEAFIQFEKTSRATLGNILGDQPVGREVSAIMSTDREEYSPKSIAIWKIGDRKPHTVDIMHPLYECFQYPILYPEGVPGWHPGKLDNNGNKLTQAKYVRCLLLSEPRFSVFGRLSEEWIVDMFCRVTEERFRYLTFMQTRNTSDEIRVAPLQELLNDETVATEGVVPGRIYLPNTVTGSPRYMQVKYLDSIAIVNRLGPPSYFITFTCNPNWPEIKLTVLPGQRADPLICARVFKLKLAVFICDIRSGLWFGKVEYLMYVIEFQKRGLPHAHICFRVEGGGPVNNIDIDKVCRADIPDLSEADGKLRKVVTDHMIHGPCGPERDNLPCYDKENRKCSKRFPKLETDVTFCDERGFINLRRNKNNEAVIKYRNKEIKINDLWVVPYNAALLLKYDAHINVEISSKRSIIKYLFKYMTKGPDETRVAIVGEKQNEIEEYVTKRYIGSSDAAWRILEFDVTAREPNVKQLPVHLNNQQSIFFKPDSIENALNRESSDLITYFKRPLDTLFDSLKYVDFYENYMVHAKRPSIKNVHIYETENGKFVTARQRGKLIARLYWVAPNRGEQFYLRLLLICFPCRGYADLLSLGGPTCTTFQEAARTVGLADDMAEYENCLLEAVTFFTGHRLRRFFVMLAINGAPVATLWDSFKNQLSEDILHRLPKEHEKAYNLCLIQINRLLQKHGSSLVEHGLPDVEDDTTELGRERIEYCINAQKSFVEEWIPKLSSEQRLVFDYIDQLCSSQTYRESHPCAIFIDGPAGTGKTLLLNVITSHVRGNRKGIVLCTASSAIAAQNHEGGITAHSMFKYPLKIIDDRGYWNMTNNTQRADLIFHADLIIYDEAPMAHKYLIHLLDRSLRDLMRSDKIFGGKIIIFAGDFRQIPPVVTNAKSNSDIVNCSVKTSNLWNKLKTFSLLTSQRCKDDPEYANFILKLGSNELPLIPVQVNGHVERLVSLELIDCVLNLRELIDFVFGLVIDEPDVCTHRAILCTTNEAIREINSIILDRVPGELLHFYSNDKIESENADQLYLGPDALNRIQPRGVPEFDLRLKEGCVCMIIRNLSFADGLVNGTKVIVEATSRQLITVRKPGGHESYLIPRILFKEPIYPNSPYEMSRRQFPLQVCYAMTIHKSQGQTIGRVGIDLRSDVFSHGQLYVALGRVREKRNIKILTHTDRVINDKLLAINKIIPELL